MSPPQPTLPRFSQGDKLGTDGGSTPAYQIIRHLGTGGAGRVYLAKVLANNDVIVLKTPRTWKLVYDLFQEARFTVRENFPHVARLRDVDHAFIPALGFEMPFIVMDPYASSLYHRLTEEKVIDPMQALKWIGDCARGLQASQLIHRDLKPENILIDDKQEAWICDFGLAIPASPVIRRKMGMQIEGVMGTLVYMPPEQIYEAPDIDVRADIYALGLVLYEMITGRPAHPVFDAGKWTEDEYLIHVCDYEVPWKNVRQEALADIVRTCTAKNRRDRYTDYWALLDAIEDALAAVRP